MDFGWALITMMIQNAFQFSKIIESEEGGISAKK